MGITSISRIVIVESLPAGELQTGRQLRDDVALHDVFHQRGLTVDLVPVATDEQFWNCLARILADANSRAERPILHIECHGSVQGIQLSDGSLIAWERLKPLLTAINVATECNLLVAMSACYGGHLTKIVQIVDRAPVWGLIGPSQPVKPHDLLMNFTSFYAELIASLDGDRALAALRASEVNAAK